MSRIEAAIEKVKRLSEPEAEALLEWLELREDPHALREKLDAEIEIGLTELRNGQKIPGNQVHEEIRLLSRSYRTKENG